MLYALSIVRCRNGIWPFPQSSGDPLRTFAFLIESRSPVSLCSQKRLCLQWALPLPFLEQERLDWKSPPRSHNEKTNKHKKTQRRRVDRNSNGGWMDTGPSAENGDGVPVWSLGAVLVLDWARPDRGGRECPSDRPPRHQALLRENWMEPSPDVH